MPSRLHPFHRGLPLLTPGHRHEEEIHSLKSELSEAKDLLAHERSDAAASVRAHEKVEPFPTPLLMITVACGLEAAAQ